MYEVPPHSDVPGNLPQETKGYHIEATAMCEPRNKGGCHAKRRAKPA